jgi:hypothetical protein
MTRQIALHALPARGGEPIRAAALDELDEVVVALGQPLLEDFALVGGVDGDRADGSLRRMRPRHREESEECGGNRRTQGDR